jgi:hypothetical protein
MSDTVHFPEGADMHEVLIALWLGTKTLGLGALHSHVQPTIADAETALKQSLRVDYFFGRPIKADFSNFPSLDCRNYDRDAGKGAMQKVADGAGPKNAPTKKLNEDEAQSLFAECNAGISIQTFDCSSSSDDE